MTIFLAIVLLVAALPILLWSVDRSKVHARDRDRAAGVTRYP